MNFVIERIVRNFLRLQDPPPDPLDRQDFSTDLMRVNFENQFQDIIIGQPEIQTLRNFTQTINEGDLNQDNQQVLRDVIVNGNFGLIEAKAQNLPDRFFEYKNLLRFKKENKIENFYSNLTIKSEGPCSDFLRQLIEFKKNIIQCSRFYSI